MPRKPRQYLPGIPSHVIQRGNNRQPCFFGVDDYQGYLSFLGNACRRYKVSVHAYVLMTNHVHLLMTPTSCEGISLVMQSLGRQYVQFINSKYLRYGTLWESRHKSSLVDADSYLLSCYRYIELNPVRAGMVGHPRAFRWSSYSRNAEGAPNDLISEHSVYESLGPNPECRQLTYRALLETNLSHGELRDIRLAAHASRPLGSDLFRKTIEKNMRRILSQGQVAGPGSPPDRQPK